MSFDSTVHAAASIDTRGGPILPSIFSLFVTITKWMFMILKLVLVKKDDDMDKYESFSNLEG